MSEVRITAYDDQRQRSDYVRSKEYQLLTHDQEVKEAIENINVSVDTSGLATEETLNNLNGKITACDTDNVIVSNQISGFATETTSTEIKNKLPALNSNREYNEVYLNTAVATAVIADSTTNPREDENKRNGWYWKNENENDKFNWYFYSGENKNYTVGDLKYFYFDALHQVIADENSICYFILYTKPTGVNDAEVWYHSAITYKVSDISDISQNITRFTTSDAELVNENELPIKILDNKTVIGEGLDNEEILYLTLQTDSATPQNNLDVLVSQVGFKLNENDYNTKLYSRKNDNKELEATLETLNNKIIACDTGSVNVSNQISGFATETTLGDIKNNLDTVITLDNEPAPTSVVVNGGVHTATPREVQDGDVSSFFVAPDGSLITRTRCESQALVDGVSNNEKIPLACDGNFMATPTFPFVYNGNTWDRIRGDTDGLKVSDATTHDALGNLALGLNDISTGTKQDNIVNAIINEGSKFDESLTFKRRDGLCYSVPFRVFGVNGKNFNMGTLMNPLGSGKKMFIYEISCSSAGQQEFILERIEGASGGVSTTPINLHFGSSNTTSMVALQRNDFVGDPAITSTNPVRFSNYRLGTGSSQMVLNFIESYIEIDEGYGIALRVNEEETSQGVIKYFEDDVPAPPPAP